MKVRWRSATRLLQTGDTDAGRLSDMFNRRAAFDKALEVKWLTIGKKDAPARYQQVINAVQKLCPDLAPYVEPMF